MRGKSILTWPGRAATALLLVVAVHAPAGAQTGAGASAMDADTALLEMRQAARQKDTARLAALLPLLAGHPLEPWAAYWELKARLDTATPQEVQAFAARWPGSYQEDRLRNDWLLLAGKRRDWDAFRTEYPRFRMRDDREVRCYATASELMRGQSASAETAAQVKQDWYAQRDLDDGCLLAADLLRQAGRLTTADIWAKARLAMEAKRTSLARAAVALVSSDAALSFAQVQASPIRYLAGRGPRSSELTVLALVRLAAQDPDQAALQLSGAAGADLSAAQRNWVWGTIGKQAALNLSDLATSYYAKVTRPQDLTDDMLAWQARAALRQGDWRQVLRAVDAMSDAREERDLWVYWKARAQLALARTDAERSAARAGLEALANASGALGFYEQLAREDLGLPIVTPPAPAPLTAAEKEGARGNIGLNRALLAILAGLRGEGVREWNYETNLHTPGGMSDRERYAAAAFACERRVWDRCISSSERTEGFMDFAQRYPMPHEGEVVAQSRSTGIDPAYVYGLIRQESRFVLDARSGVGASGMMQIMPATARWTARKIGLDGFSGSQINELDTNLLIGTNYLKLALDEFGDSLPMAAAAYNAGPGRPRAWRAPGGSGPRLDGAIWVENIPFMETRHYVKNVLANTVNYAAMLTGQPQSLKQRLGTIGPAAPDEVARTKDLP